MASPQAYDKFFASNKVNTWPVDGSYSTAAISTAVGTTAEVWLDMKGYTGIAVLATGINLTGVGVEEISIVGDSDSDGGSGTNVVIATSSDTAATGEGGWITVEASAEQIAQEGADNSVRLRYVGIKLENGNNGDEAVITTIRYGGPKYDGLTAPTVAGATVA